MKKLTDTETKGAAQSLSHSELLDELGLEKLLKYIMNPRKYVRESLMKDNPSDDDLEDYEAWAASRARHILEKLSSSNMSEKSTYIRQI